MGIQATLVLYGVMGAGVAVAMLVRSDPGGGATWFQMLTAWLFWPLYVPLLLSGPATEMMEPAPKAAGERAVSTRDEMAVTIERVEAELYEALDSLEGWAELTLAGELSRIDELQQAWRSQAQRIRELSRLLNAAALEIDPTPGPGDGTECSPVRVHQSEKARQANLRRLREIHSRMYADLMNTLARVRELVTMIHLARYTGAPASRAEDLVAQIATAVEGLSEVSELLGPESALSA